MELSVGDILAEVSNEAYNMYKKGSKVVIVAPPGIGKTTQIIPRLATLLRPVIISAPYYSTVEILRQHVPALVIEGSQRYCPLRSLWFPGRCSRCKFARCATLVDWELAREGRAPPCCPRNALYTTARDTKANLIKTHSNGFDDGVRVYISDEVHIQLLGRPTIISRGSREYEKAAYSDEDLKNLMEELMERAFKDDQEAIEEVRIIYELLHSLRYVDEDVAYIIRKYPRPRRGDPDIGLTATPYGINALYRSRPTIISVRVPKKVEIMYVSNVDTRSRYFDPALVSRFLRYLVHAHSDVALFASRRVLHELNVEGVHTYEIWGAQSVGVTLTHAALAVASPWLPPPIYERYPQAEALTAAQLVQVIHRVRPLWRQTAIYTLFDPRPLLSSDSNYEIVEVVFDGEKIRKV